MSKIRFRPLSDDLLKPIREAGPPLRIRPGQRPEATKDKAPAGTLGQVHPIHFLGLTDLVEGGQIGETPVAIRVLESRGQDITAFYDLKLLDGGPRVMTRGATDNDFGSSLKQALAAATRWADERDDEADLRLLRIPALHTEALLLRTKGQKEEIAIVVRTLQRDVETLKPMPLSELLSRLEAPARVVLEHDDGLKGS